MHPNEQSCWEFSVGSTCFPIPPLRISLCLSFPVGLLSISVHLPQKLTPRKTKGMKEKICFNILREWYQFEIWKNDGFK